MLLLPIEMNDLVISKHVLIRGYISDPTSHHALHNPATKTRVMFQNAPARHFLHIAMSRMYTSCGWVIKYQTVAVPECDRTQRRLVVARQHGCCALTLHHVFQRCLRNQVKVHCARAFVIIHVRGLKKNQTYDGSILSWLFENSKSLLLSAKAVTLNNGPFLNNTCINVLTAKLAMSNSMHTVLYDPGLFTSTFTPSSVSVISLSDKTLLKRPKLPFTDLQ